MQKAFRVASSGRPGPVHIDLPKDMLNAVITGPAPPVKPPRVNARELPDELFEDAAERINACSRPLLLAGQGAAGAYELVRKLARKGGFPTTTTVHGLGIFDERDPLSLKMMGMHGAAYANFAVQEADLLFNIGGRFDDRTTGMIGSYARPAREAGRTGKGGVLHIDIRGEVIGRVLSPDVGFEADTAHVLKRLLPRILRPDELPSNVAREREQWREHVQQLKAKHPLGYIALPDGRIKTQQAVEAVNAVADRLGLLDTAFVTTGVGNHQMMAAQFVNWTRPRQMVTSGSLGTMGVGLPFAIGAQVAHPDSLVILVDGDGSFNMTCGDLQTVARYSLPVKIAIMNDNRQQMVWVWQKLFHGERYISTTNQNPDYAQFVGSFGIAYSSVDHVSELTAAVEAWLQTPGPAVLDFRVVPDICLPMVAPGKGLDEMMLLQDHARIWGNEVEFEGMAPS